MSINRDRIAVCFLLVACLAIPAQAADRVRVGQWVGTTIVGGKTYPTSSCISQKDADGMNGDAKAVAVYLQTIIPPEICSITDVKVDGSQVIYTATCRGVAAKVVTTSYHGTSSDGTDSAGGKSTAKLVGPCKQARANLPQNPGTVRGLTIVAR
jgi:hypothetical protein